MSWWNAKYKNNHGEYEITFGSQKYEKAKAVEKVCCAVIDKKVNSPDDVEIVRHGRWVPVPSSDTVMGKAYTCSECEKMRFGSFKPNYCPHCGAKMDSEV